MSSTHLGFPIETVIVFILLSVSAIVIDLALHRKNKSTSLQHAILWSFFWIAIALIFSLYLYFHHGFEVASLFITGYALEKALSFDNLFIMMAIFSWFAIPTHFRHRVLYWGIIGAILFRAIFVAIGTSLLTLGPWVEFLFAIIIVWSAIMMLKNDNQPTDIQDYSRHFAYRVVNHFFPIWPKLHGSDFFVSQKTVDDELAKSENSRITLSGKKKKGYYATPMLLCLTVIELSDVMFAFDSVPAVIAVSREPLIVYSAMMFAIFGLRTLYFVLEALKHHLVYLEQTVVALLLFIALKLVLSASDHFVHHGLSFGAVTSLVIILGILVIGFGASTLRIQKKR